MRDSLRKLAVPRSVHLGLLTVLCLAVAPHAWHLHPWITGYFYLMAGFYLLTQYRPRLKPGRLLLLLLIIGGIANVLFNGGGLDGRQSGSSLLTVMLGLKLLETHNRRDIYVALFLGYFMVATQFLFEQGLWLSLYLGLVVLGLTTVLTSLHRVNPTPVWWLNGQESARLLVASVPLMVVLFVLFPRLSGPLWQLDTATGSATTGLNDRLRMGEISRLSRSSELAFRVRFDSAPPPNSERYWRGPVLWLTDGREWLPAHNLSLKPPPYRALGPATGYEVTLEPHNRHWLYALDLPASHPDDAVMGKDFQIQSRREVRKRLQYHLVSHTAYRVLEISDRELELALQYPDSSVTERMLALVAQWRGEARSDTEVIEQALRHFNREAFVYTLSPPRLGELPVDEFLFETRRGFCEHYASSFALLMRIAGIPSRIVTGYQGGEWNPQGDYLAVRQSEAHAWTEVWLGEAGWKRVDPTAAVAPERIERPIDPDLAGDGAVRFQVGELGLLADFWRNSRWLVESLEYSWQHWVVNFTQDSQHRLLEDLGLGFLDGYWLGVASVVGGLVCLLPIWWLLRNRARRQPDPLLRSYQQFRDKLGKAGLAAPASLGPHDLGQLAAGRFSDQAPRILLISRLYIALRYGRRSDPAAVRRLQGMVRRLKLKPVSSG